MITEAVRARIDALPKERAKTFTDLVKMAGVEDKHILPLLIQAEGAGLQAKVDKLLDFVQQRGTALALELGVNAGKVIVAIGSHDDKVAQLQSVAEPEIRAKAAELGIVVGSIVYDVQAGAKYQPVKKVGGGGGDNQPREGSSTVSGGVEHPSEYAAAKHWGWVSGGVKAQFGARTEVYHRRSYIPFKVAAEAYFKATGEKPFILKKLGEKP